MENEYDLSEQKITAVREIFSLFDKKNTASVHIKFLPVMVA